MSDSTENANKPLDMGALSDDEFAQLSPTEVEELLKAELAGETEDTGESVNDSEASEEQSAADESAVAGEEESTEAEETDGAVSDFQPLDPHAEMAGTTHVEESSAGATEEAAETSGEDDQSSEASGEAESTDSTDYKTLYEGLLAPFKASKRTVKVESPDDARRLMQMGYDYTEKMRQLKPQLRIIKTLEHNDLLDIEKVNFAIDLLKGNEDAVKKFLKDNSIDPIEMDLEDGTDYKPNDHLVSEQQMALDEVLDDISGSEVFPRTAQVITKEWDKASQDVLMGIPALIRIIHGHMEKGYYDQIADKVRYERSMGRLQGLSDLDAYKAVGDAMQAQGAFKAPAGAGNTSSTTSGQGPSQDSKGSDASNVKARKRAASPTKGNASAGNAQAQKNYLGDFTDAEIEAMG